MTWTEDDDDLWGGNAPTIEIYFDETNQFLLSIYFQIDTKRRNLESLNWLLNLQRY